jgi:hypothetical protein
MLLRAGTRLQFQRRACSTNWPSCGSVLSTHLERRSENNEQQIEDLPSANFGRNDFRQRYMNKRMKHELLIDSDTGIFTGFVKQLLHRPRYYAEE